MPEQGVARRLKALRERSGLSVREVVDQLRVPLSTYSSKERSTYKRHYLPREWAENLVSVLAGRGSPPITRADVLALAGEGVGTTAAEAAPQMLRGFGGRLTKAREGLGLDIAQLAAATGVDEARVAMWEQGELLPDAFSLARLAAAGISADWVLVGENVEGRQPAPSAPLPTEAAQGKEELALLHWWRYDLDDRGRRMVVGMMHPPAPKRSVA